MKLYNFTANDYGENWFVCAESREAAIQAVRSTIEREFAEAPAKAKAEIEAMRVESPNEAWTQEGIERSVNGSVERAKDHRDYQLEHLECCIENKGSYPGAEPCSIEEIEPGVVVFTEVS